MDKILGDSASTCSTQAMLLELGSQVREVTTLGRQDAQLWAEDAASQATFLSKTWGS